MKSNNHLSNRFGKWRLFSVLPGLMLAHAALATGLLYQNYAVLNYSVPGSPPPQIDDTAFDNEGTFNVSFYVYSPNPAFFETWNTLNYTNNGTMTVNAPYTGVTFGCGFRFDKQTQNGNPHTMAGTFYNPNTVRCDSFLDGNSIFIINGAQTFSLATIGECIVLATNVVNPGTIQVGVNGLIQLTGQNADLTLGTLTVENLQSLFFGNSPGVNSFGAFGIDTNLDWDPSIYLGPTTATGSLPYPLSLANSTAYFDRQTPSTNLVIIRTVFVQNNSPGVPYNVYIDPLDSANLGFAPGAAHVEWLAPVVDWATGGTTTYHLYLTDDYVQGANVTNLFLVNGVPDNFTFLTSTTPLLFGPVGSGFPGFPSGVVTNNPYSYFNAQLIASTTPTNVTASNPSGALTNLPGRIQITANNELNLGQAAISGMNYLSLLATNQFDGSAGAQIAAPYSDINLGVTNGFLVVTNLLESELPDWGGTVQAWSTRWLTTSSNTLDGINYFIVTNDYRVLLVNSSYLTPTTQPQVQNLKLHATNSLVITDVLNVFGSLFIDAQNLTLTTNIIGVGATSPDGELNFESGAILWQSALPNLRNLTNNGAIRAQNQITFGGPSPASYQSFINHSLVSDLASIIYADYFESDSTFTNGPGSFLLQSLNTVIANGSVTAGGDVSITTGSLVASNLVIQAGRKLTLQVTNSLTDTGVPNGNVWVVGSAGISGSDSGFNLPLLPTNSINRMAYGDLLGTTVTNIAPARKSIINTWAGQDFGVSPAGYTNNVAVGRLILDSLGTSSTFGSFTFNGAGVSNAIYVDYLEFRDQATNGVYNNYDFSPWLSINTNNMMIYFAQAVVDGFSVAGYIDVASRDFGRNGGRLRWVTNYAGYYSSTNIVQLNGTTTAVNAALAQSPDIDSDCVGAYNPTPFPPIFSSNDVNLTLTLTNKPSFMTLLTWRAISGATNYVLYKTNLPSTNWLTLTNFVSTGTPLLTNTLSEPLSPTGPRYYRVQMDQNWKSAHGP